MDRMDADQPSAKQQKHTMTSLKRCKAEEPTISTSSGTDMAGGSEPEQKRLKEAEIDQPETAAIAHTATRSSRGRARVAPSRFKDSVMLDPSIKDKSSSKTNPVGEGAATSAPTSLKFTISYSRKNKNSDTNAMNSSLNFNVKEEPVMAIDPLPESERKEDFYLPEDFVVGDVIWAKASRKSPAWPAIVIDPIESAPDAVLNSCVPGAICIMYLGFSGNGKNRDYGWVKEGSIFPFLDYIVRFQSEKLGKQKSSFLKAVEEAFVVQKIGFCESEPHSTDGPSCSNATTNEPSSTGQAQENMCTSCGRRIPVPKKSKKHDQSEKQEKQLCKPCAKLFESKQYCGVCKKVWYATDGGNYVQCEGCKIWCHSDCIKNYTVEELANINYFCPDCKSKGKRKIDTVATNSIAVSRSDNKIENLPDAIPVFCQDFEGLYLPKEHLIQCSCKSCKGKKLSPALFERHTGSRKKNWKLCVRTKDTMQLLVTLLGEVPRSISASHSITVSRKEKLLELLEEPYVAVQAKWMTERCTICRGLWDWEKNYIIFCNRCQVSVHQECYGVTDVTDFSSWVCKACENPSVIRECCLCPVKGGALKRTDVPGLWVHVTCGWYQPQVSFQDAKTMEPAEGILRIPLESFKKVCSICKQMHGACTQCCMCSTYYHAICASRAGYDMELHYSEVKGRQITRFDSYCPNHREPNENHALTVVTAETDNATEVSDRNEEKPTLLRLVRKENEKEKERVSEKTVLPLTKPAEDEVPAARCRVYVKTNRKESRDEAIAHRTMGPRQHPLEKIDSLNQYEGEATIFSTFSERLHHLMKSENYRVCYGKSGIHGWGLFARRTIQEGEMVIEYRGELVRRSVSDVREKRYLAQRKDCYFFKISEELVVDATNGGNIARLINHSCQPNCYARNVTMREQEHKEYKLVFIAKTRIPAGQELTFDYLFDPDEAGLKVPCLCKALTCRGYM